MSKPAEGRPVEVAGINLQEIYQYLDALRESGVTNMFGAGIYLQEEYGIDKYEARTILGFWMKDFGKDDS